MMNYETKKRQRRVREGLCYRCGSGRGKDGTKTMCRHCADKNNTRIIMSKHGGYVRAKCENCFKRFERRLRGRRVFCDACLAWFDTKAVDTLAEQAQAQKIFGPTIPDLLLDLARQ